ncbi:MAG: iron ABC transporter permease [Nisaea sp.]|uniref:FecCD family ABC transporter permease n=1 Tax=Nisaea sp. TaxID=2024842 RepID=UPI001B0B2306|nr:iron ABC transporter permease [Nisaea sp.]MBO6560973.1 iron ABC transporter permease [Nisaea sp.]
MSETSALPRHAAARFAGIPVFALLGAALLIVVFAELALGPVRLGPGDLLAVLLGEGEQGPSAILLQIRLPRAVLGLAVGFGLALSGCAMQGVLRNPLADPGLIGVTAGAAVGAVSVIVLGNYFVGDLPAPVRPYALPLGAFAGGLLVTAFVFSLSHLSGGTNVAMLILAGVAVNAIAGALIGAMVYISDDQQLRDLTFWSMGSIASGNWMQVSVTTMLALAAALGLLTMGRSLDLFQLGERAAFHAGIDIEREKWRIALMTAIAVGAVTAAAGPIGFIGLVAPHMARLIVGPAHRNVLPAAALIGGALILGADLAVRLAVPPTEPPIGLATSMIGGPFFLWLLMRRLKRGGF